MPTYYSFPTNLNDEDSMLVTTNKRLVQVITLMLSLAIVFPPQIAVAAQTSAFQLGMEAKDAKKWKKALSHFNAVLESDPNYGIALDEIALINDLQKDERQAHNTRYKAERLMEKLDRGADKCLGLLKRDGSPEVHGCFEEMSKVEGEISDMLRNSEYEHKPLKDLDKQLVPFRKFDEIALPVTKVRPTRDEMEQATEKILALEQYVDDQNNPPNLVALGAFVLSQFHLGGARAHAKDCARLTSDPETRNTKATADICGFAEEASMKYGDFVRRLSSSNLIDGPSIPSIAYKAVAPIESHKLPKPEVISVLVATPKVQDSPSSWTTYLVVGGITGIAAILGTAFLKMRPKPQQQTVKTEASVAPQAVQSSQPPVTAVETLVHRQPAQLDSQGEETKAPSSPKVVTGQQEEESQTIKLAALKKRIAQLAVKENVVEAASVPESVTGVLKESNVSPKILAGKSRFAAADAPNHVAKVTESAAAPRRGYVPLVSEGKDPIGAFENAIGSWSRLRGEGFAMLQRIAEEQGVTLVKDNPRATTYALTATVRPDAGDTAKQIADIANKARMQKVGVIK
jgi:hypothetical protein